jgi:hypothetical protein
MAEVPETLVAPAPFAPAGAWTLGDDRLRVVVTDRGAGVSTFEGRALYRGSEDPRDDDGGWAIYIDEPGFDKPGRAAWSIGASPCHPTEGALATSIVAAEGPAFVREQHDVLARLSVYAARARLELRRVTLVHRGTAPRTIGVTSAFDVVLHDADADRTPRFPAVRPDRVRRGPRRGHRVARARGGRSSAPRLRRAEDMEPSSTPTAPLPGRTTGRDRPRALASGEPLSRTSGNVLDPVAALRVERTVAPGERLELTFVLAAAATRDEALAALDRARAAGFAALAAEAAAPPAPAEFGRVFAGVPAALFPEAAPAMDGEGRRSWNGAGAFAPDGREYVIRGRTPQPGSTCWRTSSSAASSARLGRARRGASTAASAGSRRGATILCSTRTARPCTCATRSRARSSRRCRDLRPGARTRSATGSARRHAASRRSGSRSRPR